MEETDFDRSVPRSESCYTSEPYLVKEARHKKTILIVKLEWLEDSLMQTRPKRVKLDGYLWEQRRLRGIQRAQKKVSSQEVSCKGREIVTKVLSLDEKIERASSSGYSTTVLVEAHTSNR